ncbi:hypothetical protein SAMN05444414_102228 [Roseovarius marisflavi]|uniref:Uncharacterized protein n=1 Tax=Roseovarius marisflavi TaxID=1054996 RepID=A0A1M6WBJ9_9RHOB|nr:hypothetical protein [Roseovarius marisflavi]SHK91071.1 hypothetical protein SAMN05444414_102228 [Roseovarius marisflavi]
MTVTALSKYQRLEAQALWRATPEAQRIDVIASVGEATLTITDTRDRVLAHWSLAAIARSNPGAHPAIYHPDGDPGETLEVPEDEVQMIEAIDKLRAAISRQRPRPGRLRLVGFLTSLAAVVALAVFWLPGAARKHALVVVPAVKRAEIGQSLLEHLQKVTGPACRGPGGAAALAELAKRLPAPQAAGAVRFLVVRGGVAGALRLPGGTVLINAALVEDYEEPDVVAGHIVAAYRRAEGSDPLDRLLAQGGISASLRLLTTGALPEEALRAHAEALLTDPPDPLDPEALLTGFRTWEIRATPYAYALDITGETVLPLIEADPFADAPPPPPILSDQDWLRLQAICVG